MKINSLLIIDFYNLPPLRREVTKQMYSWLIHQWSVNSKNTIKKLTTLSKISKQISTSLDKKNTLIIKGKILISKISCLKRIISPKRPHKQTKIPPAKEQTNKIAIVITKLSSHEKPSQVNG